MWGLGDYAELSEALRPAAEALADACAVSAGQEVLDVAAGDGNFAVACAREGARVVASDLSPGMVERGRARSEREGYDIEWVEADVEDLPFEDGEFDLVQSFAGLHCFPNPRKAVLEIARVVKPGGRFTGSVFLTGTGLRYLPGIIGGRLAGVMGPSGSRSDLDSWLHEAGFQNVRIDMSGAIGYFAATKPG